MTYIERIDEFFSRNIFNGKSIEEREKMLKSRAMEILDAIEKAGYKGFHINTSVTHFGVSVYIQGAYGLKFRLSDHGVTNINRIKYEEHIWMDTPIETVLDIIKDADERAKILTKKFDEQERRYKELDMKWERIKDNFDGLSFHTCNRTYQTLEQFKEAGIRNGKPRTNIYQKTLDPGYRQSAFYYEWTEPVSKNELRKEKPSYDYIENYEE